MYRIPLLAVTNRPCQVPLGFDLDAYVRDSLVGIISNSARLRHRNGRDSLRSNKRGR